MTDEETRELLATSTEIDRFDRQNPTDPDDYANLVLYKAQDGRHFRFVENSGMSSIWSGGMSIVEWLEEGEVETWSAL